MAAIGKPDSLVNSFAHIKMREKTPENSGKTKGNIGDLLNKISGEKSRHQFVDRKTHNKLGKDEFLKILSYQLTNQDPFNPTDQKKFAADLAQFASLEQLSNINGKMEQLNVNAPSESKFHGAGFLGKEVITKGTSLELREDGQQVSVPFYLDRNAKKLRIRFFDQNKQLVAELMEKELPKGGHALEWNGMRMDDVPAAAGVYRVSITGWDKDFNQFTAETKTRGLVTGVNFENGKTILVVDGAKKIFLRDVESFQLPVNNRIKTHSDNDLARSQILKTDGTK